MAMKFHDESCTRMLILYMLAVCCFDMSVVGTISHILRSGAPTSSSAACTWMLD